MSTLDAQHGFERCMAPLLVHTGTQADLTLGSNACEMLVDNGLPMQLHVDDDGVLTLTVRLSRPSAELTKNGLIALLLNNRPGDMYPAIASVLDARTRQLVVRTKLRHHEIRDADFVDLFDRVVNRSRALESMLDSYA